MFEVLCPFNYARAYSHQSDTKNETLWRLFRDSEIMESYNPQCWCTRQESCTIVKNVIPVRASQESTAAKKITEHVADSKALRRFDVEQTQPAARKVIAKLLPEVREAAPKSGSDTKDSPGR
jgi:hypothetical protein